MKPYIEMYRRWTTVPGVQAADIAVLSALYAHADRAGVCTATQGELAEELGQSRAWINPILKALQEPPVALVAARPQRGFRGYLYELTGADMSCQPADIGVRPTEHPLGSENPLNPESSSLPREGRGDLAMALPGDWRPNADDLAWATTQRPDVDPAAVTAKFVAWCRKAHSRNGYRPADPSAAWRRWIARELLSPSPMPHREFRHERRLHRPTADQPATGTSGSGPNGTAVAARNHDTLAALRNRLSCPA